MKDNFGNELKEGDAVYFASGHGYGKNYKLAMGVVRGFTKMKVKIEPTKNWLAEFESDKGNFVYVGCDKIGKVNA